MGTTLRAAAQPGTYLVDKIPVKRLGFSFAEKLRMVPAVAGYYLAQGTTIRSLASLIAIKLSQDAIEADLIHNGRIGRAPLTYASLKVARRRGLPFVLTPYHHPRWGGRLHRHYTSLYRETDAILSLTQAEKGVLVELGVPEERIHVTGMAPIVASEADPVRFCENTGIEQPFVLFLGQHYKYKGYKELLRAAPLVWQRIPEAAFVFIGPPVGRSEQVFHSQKDPRIHRLGVVDLQTKTDALSACSLLCVPSIQESFGGVYTEAWSARKPVIGCPIPAVAEIVDQGRDGLLAKQRPQELAEAILQLLLHPAEAARMGEEGHRKVADQYTWERVARRTQEAYERVL